jgi:hypothetical protein
MFNPFVAYQYNNLYNVIGDKKTGISQTQKTVEKNNGFFIGK